MKSIKFSESELEFLRNHYELELMETENYVVEIKNILKKLGAEIKASEPEKPKKRRGRPPKTKNVIARSEATKQEEGRGKKEKGKVAETAKSVAAAPAKRKTKRKKTAPKKNVVASAAKQSTKKQAVKKPAPDLKPEMKPTEPAPTPTVPEEK